jgi:hypothetical protein
VHLIFVVANVHLPIARRASLQQMSLDTGDYGRAFPLRGNDFCFEESVDLASNVRPSPRIGIAVFGNSGNNSLWLPNQTTIAKDRRPSDGRASTARPESNPRLKIR